MGIIVDELSFRTVILNYRAMSVVLNTLLLLTQVTLIFSALPQIKKCQLSDGACIKSSSQPVVPILAAGIPEIGLEPFDPMRVDLINVDLSGLKLTVKDADVKGLRNSIIDKLSVDMAKKQMQLAFHADFSLKGKYKATGKLLILPISGDGDILIKLKNCHLQVNIPFDVEKNSNGKDFINLKSYKYSFDVKDNTHFHLTNLFNGNKGLSDTMLNFMNENWKTLTLEFGKPMFDQPILKVFTTIKKYFASQPLEDIADL